MSPKGGKARNQSSAPLVGPTPEVILAIGTSLLLRYRENEVLGGPPSPAFRTDGQAERAEWFDEEE